MKKLVSLWIIIHLALYFTSPANAQRRAATSEMNPEYLKWAGVKREILTTGGHAMGEIPLPYKINVELPESLKKQFLQIQKAEVSYDLRSTGGVTSVKNQGSCGSCWTFGTMGSIESHWLVDGRGTYDLSEDNLNTCHPPFIVEPCDGGNAYMSTAYLVRGSGPLSESDDPYSDTHTSVDCPMGFDPQGIITSTWFLPTSDPELIKNLIVEHGALATNMYYTESSYNPADYTYYYDGPASGTNHAVTLVGWDDNKVTAGGTGAWIIKNSWDTDWGEGGYFYVAYQDVEINSDVVLFEDYIDYDPDETVATYSESGWLGYNFGYGTNTADVLVKFVATGNVQLTKIGTFTGNPGAIVSIEIYDDFDGSALLTGLLGSISAQTCTYTGYHSFDLSSPVSISDGNDYYVKISYETPGYNYPVPCEVVISGFSDPTISTGVFWSKETASSTWYSEDPYEDDPCVYAYTVSAEETVATPEFSPSPGTYGAAQDVTISCSTPDATIHYTTNGVDPTESDPEYSTPVHIASTTTLKARAYKTGYDASDIASGEYIISDLTAPAAPGNLVATAGDKQVELHWDRNTEPDVHKYNIYRDITSPAVTLVDSVVAASPPDTFFVDAGLTSGQEYFYRITAVDSAKNESGFSNEVNAIPFDFTVDSLALVALYNSTDGDNWTTNTNWLTVPVDTWYGITVEDGRVTSISLSGNNLNGSIPPDIGNLNNLKYMEMHGNQLSGNIPQEIGNLSNLLSLQMNFNQLTGNIPPEIGNLVNLSDIFIENNQLTGSIPPEIDNLTNLVVLSLSGNQISGAIPPELGSLTNLEELSISDNQISGSIPPEIGNISNMRFLNLANNQITGSIPPEIGNMSNLLDFRVQNNQISGSIPSEISNIGSLFGFNISYNDIEDLPYLNGLTADFFEIQENKLTFEDIEPNMEVAQLEFTYAPQDSVGAKQYITLYEGESDTIFVSVGGANNIYQWYKNGSPIPGAENDSLEIIDAALTDAGIYECQITNTVATELTLYSRPIDIYVIDEDLVAYYPFNGNADDESENGLHGTITGCAFIPDRFGNPDRALHFENAPGSENNAIDYITIDDTPELRMTGEFSMNAWIQTTYDAYTGMNALGKAHGTGLYNSYVIWYMNNRLYFSIGSEASGISLDYNYPQDGQWHFVTGTWDTEYFRLFFDGIEVATATFYDNVLYDSHPLFLGADDNNGDYIADGGWNGDIDDVSIYSKALTTEEIQALFSEGGWNPPPLALWTLDATPGDQEVTLHWARSAEPDLHKYNIYRDITSPAVTLIDSVVASSPPDTFFVDDGLVNGQVYYYRITAVDSAGNESDFSPEIHIMPQAYITGEYVTDENTVLLLHLDEIYGSTAYDFSGYLNNGNITEAISANGYYGMARSFASPSDAMYVNHEPSLNFSTEPYTIELWIKVPPGSGGHPLHKRGNTPLGTSGRGWFLNIGDDKIEISLYNDPALDGEEGHTSLTSNSNIADNKWHHVAFVNTYLSILCYIDGVLDNTSSVNWPGSPDNEGTLEFGTNSHTGEFSGVMDEIRISNKVRSPAEFNIYPRINVVSPNGGDIWQVGYEREISWNSYGTSGNVHIEYSTDNGSGWSDITASTADDGSFIWTVPDEPSENCLVRISDTDGDPSDASDNVFTINYVEDCLIAWYPFSGNANDESGRSNHGTVGGATLSTDRFGRQDNSFYFDGVDDSIYVENTADFQLTSYSILGWVKINNMPSSERLIVGKDNDENSKYNFAVIIKPGMNLSAQYESCADEMDHWVYSNTLELNDWNFFAAVRDKSSGKHTIYINGNEVESIYGFDDPCANDQQLKIGHFSGPQYGYLNGTVDDIRIYNCALDESLINSFYHEDGYTEPLPAPTNFQAIRESGQITLVWDPVNDGDVHKYNIYRDYIANSVTILDSVKGTPPDTFYIDTDIDDHVSYYYHLSAVENSGIESELAYAPCIFKDTVITRFTNETITIDGLSNEAFWQSIDSTAIERLVEGEPVTDPDDLSAWFKSCWDNDNVYFYFHVNDTILLDIAGETWQNDFVELYCDMNNSQNVAVSGSLFEYYDYDDRQFRFNWNSGEITGYNIPGGIQFEQTTLPGNRGYEVEIALPWDSLGIPAGGVGVQFGLQAMVGDNDVDIKENTLSWSSTNFDSWRNPSLWGVCELRDKSGNLPTDPTAMILFNGYYHPDGYTIDLGGDYAGPEEYNLQIKNVGLNLLDNISASISGNGYSITTPPAASLSPQELSDFNIQFETGNPGQYIGNLTVTSNDPDSPYNLELTKDAGKAPDTLYVPFTNVQIIIDGDGNEATWNNIDSIPVTNLVEGNIDNPDDFSVWYKSCWDSENFYICFNITDEYLYNGHGDPWQNDCVELYFDMNNSRNVYNPEDGWTSYDFDDWQIRFVWENGDITGYPEIEGISFSHLTNAGSDGYQLEVSIPWSSLGIPAAGIGVNFGFDMQLADNDGAGDRDAVLSWNSEEVENWRDPSKNGTAELRDENNELPAEPTASIKYNGYYYPDGYSIDIGSNFYVGPEEYNFEIKNTGQSQLNSITANITGDGYSIISPPATSLNSQEYSDFTVQFDNTAPGDHTGNMNVASNDPDSPYDLELIKNIREFPDTLKTRFTSETISIDGLNDETIWQSIDSLTMERLADGVPVTGPDDLSAWFKSCWDNDNLYFYVHVNDDVLLDIAGQTWENDNIELYFDMNNSRGNEYDHDDRQIRFNWNSGEITGINVPGDIQFAQINLPEDTGYVFEIAMPWNSLGIPAGGVGVQFGFQVWVEDNDVDVRESILSWFAEVLDGWYDPSLWGVCELRDENGNLPADPTAMIKYDGYYYPDGYTVHLRSDYYYGPEDHNFEIKNIGQDILDNISLNITGDGYSINSTPPESLNPLESGDFNIRFDNSDFGEHIADLSITSNDPVSPYDLQLSAEVLRPPDITGVTYTSESIVIDGEDNESTWDNIDSTDISSLIEGSIDDPDDLTASFKSCWDEDNLYIMVKVTDDSLYNEHPTSYRNDAVQLFFDMNNSRGDSYDHDDYSLVIPLESSEVDGPQLEGLVFAYNVNQPEDDYKFEISIPWSSLGIPASGVGVSYGFDIYVIDNDGTGDREAMVAWNTLVPGNWSDPRLNGIAELRDADNEMPEDPTMFVLYNGYFYPDGFSSIGLGDFNLNDYHEFYFSIKNIGALPLTDINVSIGGDGYGMPWGPQDYLESGWTTDFAVNFQSSDYGTHIGSLNITSNDAASPYNLDLEANIAPPDTMYIPFISDPILIDGDPYKTAWDTIAEEPIEVFFSGEEDGFFGPEDLSAYWKSYYDFDGIYVLVHVTADDIHLTDDSYGAFYERDIVEIYFDMNSDNLRDGRGPSSGICVGQDNNGHYQFAALAESGQIPPPEYASFENNVVFQTILNPDNSYSVEFFIPWVDIPHESGAVFNPFINRIFGFDVIVSDNDGPENGRPRSRKVWSNNGINGECWFNLDDAGIAEPILTNLPDEAIAVISASDYACGMEGSQITVELYNYGAQTINQVDIIYAINNDTIDAETINMTINPQDTVEYTFTTPVNISVTGIYNLYVSTLIDNGNGIANAPYIGDIVIYGDTEAYEGWTCYNTCNYLPGNNSIDVLEASNGDLWVTTLDGGIARRMAGTEDWVIYNSDNSGFANNKPYCLLEDQYGNIWVGFDDDDGVVSMFDGSTWTSNNPDNNHVLFMFEDSQGNIWFANCLHGVKKWDPVADTWTTYTKENSGLASNSLWYGSIMEDDESNMWFATINWDGEGGLCKFDGTTWTVYNTENSGLSSNGIWGSLRDSQGNIWLAHPNCGEAVTKFDGDNWEYFNTGNSGIVSDNIVNIYEDSRGNIWFGSLDNGVSKFNGTSWQNFRTDNSGLTGNRINYISEDSEGNIWIPTEIGLCKYDIAGYENNSDTLNIHYTSESITIDGSDDESIWQSIEPVSIDKVIFGNVNSAGDLSARFKACWSLDTLFFLVDVTDENLNNWHGTFWENDNVDIFIDMDNSKSTECDYDDYQSLTVWEDYNRHTNQPEGTVFAFNTNESGYQLELAMPFEGAHFPFTGEIGFDIHIGDNDGENRESIISWFSDIDQNYCNPSVNGTAVLDEFDMQIADQALGVLELPETLCGLTETEITVKLVNFRSQVVNQFDIIYAINEDTIAPETANLTINPGDTAEYTFTTTATFPGAGYYNLYVSTLLDNGNPNANFSNSKEIIVFGETSIYEGWKLYSTCNGLPHNSTRYVIEDSQGDIWVSTWGGGIGRLDTETEIWTVYDTLNSELTVNDVNGLLEDSYGNIWACVDRDEGIVSKFDGSTWSNPNPDNIHTLVAFEDSQGDIWFGTWQYGVRKLDIPEGTLTTYTAENSGLAANIVWNGCIMEDTENNIWIGTSSWGGQYDSNPAGLCKFDGINWTVYNTDNSGIPANDIASALMDSQGNIWMGHGWTNGGEGVTKYDGENWINYNTGNCGIVSNVILFIYEDSKGNIWFGSPHGASMFNGTSWQNFRTDNSGLMDNNITGITEDSEGNMWFATTTGLSKFDQSLAGESDTLDIYYTTEHMEIDGIGDESIWQSIEPVSINKVIFGNVSSAGDFSAQFKACWNLDTLFFLVDVTDENLNNSHETFWQNDYVDIYLDMDNSKGTSYDANDYQILMVWEDYVHYTGQPEGTEFVFNTNETGYQLELAVPIKSAGFPFKGEIGFDIHIGDNDGEYRESIISWFSDEDQNWNNPSLNGVAQLLEFDEVIPDEALAVVSATESVCGTSETEITVELFNWGNQAIDQFDIIYAINEDTITPETAVLTINPGDTAAYTFTTAANLSVSGYYNLYVSTLLDNGNPHANISSSTELLSHGERSAYEGWTVYSTCNGRSVNRVWNMTTDSEGNIWLAAGPAEKLNPETEEWTIYNSGNSGVSNDLASAILEDHSGNIWVALDQDGQVTMFDGSTWTSNNPDNIHVLSMFEDSQDNIWFGTWDYGIRKYDVNGDVWDYYTVENSGLASNIIYRNGIMEDALGNMWFGTAGNWSGYEGGLCKFDGTDWTTYNTSNSGLPNNQILCSIMDSNGNIWMGFGWNNAGLCKFDGTDWTIFNTGNSGIITDHINVIFEDEEGNIWCGNDNGVSKFDGLNWTNYNSDNSGLFDDYVNAIAQDNDGNMWFGTGIGLFKFEQDIVGTPAIPQNLLATAGDHQVTLVWDPNTEPDLHKYNIYRDITSPAVTLIDSVVAASPPDSFFVDEGLVNGQEYFYRITAVDDWSNESDFSNEANAIPNEIIQLVFTSEPQTIYTGYVTSKKEMILEVQDEIGDPYNVGSDVTIDLATTSPTGEFSEDDDNWIGISTITILSGTHTAGFFYLDNTVGTPTITAAETPDQGWIDAEQQLTVEASALTHSPHAVGGTVETSTGAIPANGELTFSAYIISRPSEILTQASIGSGYYDGSWWMQCAQLPAGWAAGEIMHIDFVDSGSGEIGSVELMLTNNPEDNAGLVVLGLYPPVILGYSVEGTADFKFTLEDMPGNPTFNVYRDTIAFFTPDKAGGANRIATGITDEDPVEENVQWTDIGSIGNADENYFYIFTAVGGNESDNSITIGEFDYSLITTPTTDFNEIALPLCIGGVTNAAELMAAIPGCNSIARWNAEDQGYYQYISFIPVTNFSVQMGYPYYVNVTDNVVFTLVGEIVQPVFSLITTPTTDFNEVMMTLDKTDIILASELMADIPSCNSIARWNADDQGYYQYISFIPVTNFNVRVGYPYYVNVSSNVTWPQAGEGAAHLKSTAEQVIIEKSNAPHMVYGIIKIKDLNINESEIDFSAYISSMPDERLDKSSVGCTMQDGYWIVQCTTFPSGWTAGETVVVEFSDKSGNALAKAEVELTYNPADRADDIVIEGQKDCFLSQNIPNPFSDETIIRYQIPEYGFVQIEVYSVTGQKIKTLVHEYKEEGIHTVTWNARDDFGKEMQEGMYMYVLKNRDKVIFRKAIMLK